MSDDTTTDLPQDEQAQGEDDRQGRSEELTDEAAALFSAAALADGDATTADDTAEAAPEGEQAGEVATEGDEDSEDEDSDDEDNDTGTDTDEDADSAEAPAPEPAKAASSAAFGLLFQAPDLSDLPRRRSRRATSGVTTPPPVAEAVEPEDEATPTSTQTEDGPEEQSGEGSRSSSRRRRGGKGRRGRGGSDQSDADDASSTDDADTASADSGRETGAGDDADEQGGSTEQSGQGSSRRRSRGRGRSASSGTGSEGSADEGNANRGAGNTGSKGSDQGATQDQGDDDSESGADAESDGDSGTRRRRRRRRSGESGSGTERSARDQVTSVRGSTRLEAKRQRRREGREAGRRRTIITEAEFLARRESVDRVMVVRGLEDRTQIAVLEDGVPVEHYVSRSAQSTMVGNVYLGRVQNVLPSMEAAFVDIGKGRNAVLYAGEVNWDAAGMVGNEAKRIENALKAGESVLVQVTKDPIGHKGARLTSQVSLPGRFLVYVPGSTMTGISRKLPDNERTRLKKILKEVVPADAGVIVRTAAEGASEAELRADVERLTAQWEKIQTKSRTAKAPALLHGEPDMTVRVIRDVFTEDFSKLVVSGAEAWTEVKRYIDDVAPDLAPRVEKYTGSNDIFTTYRVHEAVAKAMDRKVWLPSGGSLIIDRTEAMTVVDVNTGKFTGSGGNLEETVTKNNIEAAEEIVRQLRLRDIGGIIVVDFIDMVLESNRELVVRRLLECLGRDRTKHQVAEVTSLGLVQMTRKRVGSGLIDVFSEPCAHCSGRGIVVHTEPLGKSSGDTGHGSSGNGGGASGGNGSSEGSGRRGRGRGRGSNGSNGNGNGNGPSEGKNVLPTPNPNGPTPAQIAAAAHAAAVAAGSGESGKDADDQPAAAEGSWSSTTVEVVETSVTVTEPDAGPETTVTVSEPTVPEPDAETEQDAAPEPKPRARRAKAKVQTPAPVAAPEPAPDPEPVVQGPVVQEQVVQEPEPEPAAPKRRRRGRVSAPAGPPSGAEDTPGQ